MNEFADFEYPGRDIQGKSICLNGDDFLLSPGVKSVSLRVVMQSVQETMKGVYLTGHGGLEKLQYREDIPVPEPGPRDVLVRVAAAGVNNTDLNTRKAWYSRHESDAEDAGWSGQPLSFPRIQGADVCGRIAAVGEQVDTERLGQRVILEPCFREFDGERLDSAWYLGSECDGGFAEYVRVPATHAYPVNSTLTDIELASFPCSYSTAENMLTRAGVSEGERVLVTGASGGVGSAAVQLARARGAYVIAQTSPAKREALLELGANDVVDRTTNLPDNPGDSSVDAVIDLVAGPQWPDLLTILRPGGRYAVAGAIAGPIVELDVRTLYLKDLSVFGCTVLEPTVFSNLVKHVERGKVRPLIEKTYPLQQIAAAQCEFQKKRHVGKLVLEINTG